MIMLYDEQIEEPPAFCMRLWYALCNLMLLSMLCAQRSCSKSLRFILSHRKQKKNSLHLIRLTFFDDVHVYFVFSVFQFVKNQAVSLMIFLLFQQMLKQQFCLVFTLLSFGQQLNLMPSVGFSTTQVTIWTNSIAHSTNSTSNYRFNFLLDTPPNNLQRVFAVLAGYSLENANSIDYFVNLIFYNASLPLTLEFNCYGDMKVYSMSFAVIAIAPPSNPYLTLEEYMITPQNISTSNVTLNSSRTSEVVNLKSMVYFSHNQYKLISYLSYAKCTNIYFQPGLSFYPPNYNINSNDFSMQIKVTIGAQLVLVRATIFIIDQLEIYRRNKIYFVSSYILVISNYPGAANSPFSSQISTTLNIPNDYGPKYSRNCTLGIVTLTHANNNLHKQFLYNYSTSLGFTDIQEVSAGSTTQLIAFCTIDCYLNSFYNATGNQCEVCSNYIPKCRGCNNATYCTNCGLNAFFDPLYIQCLCNGYQVTGGCTTIRYCTQIDPETALCLTCGSNFSLTANQKACVCLVDINIINGLCTNISGCLTADMINNKPQCLACNISAYYRLTINFTCECTEGLSAVGGYCMPICGDGKLYLSQQCDDGNTINGDGCSSSCKQQALYLCTNVAATQPSICCYLRQIKASIKNISKDVYSNTAIFAISFSPAPFLLSRANFSTGITFSTKPRYGDYIAAYSSSDSLLILSVPFLQDFQSQLASLNITIDSSLISNNFFSLNFAMVSTNYPLVMFHHYSQVENYRFLMMIITIVAVIAFILGSWSHKMIGVETMSVFLFTFYSLCIGTAQTEEMFTPIAELRYLANYGDAFNSPLGSHSFIIDYLHIRTKFIENNYILQAVFIFGLVAISWTALLHLRRKEREKMAKDTRYFDSKLFRLVFYLILIPISLGYFYQTFITAFLSVLTINSYHSFQFDQIFSMIGLVGCCVVICAQCCNTLFINACKDTYSSSYFVSFTFNSLANVFLLVLCFKWNGFIYALVLQNIIYMIYLFVNPPYSSKLNLSALLINQLIIILWLAVLIAIPLFQFSQGIKADFMMIEIVLLGIVDILALVRTIYELCYFGSQKTKIYMTNIKTQLPKHLKANNSLLRNEILTKSLAHQQSKRQFYKKYDLEMIINYLPDTDLQPKQEFCEDNEADFLKSRAKTNMGEWVKQERKYAINEFGAQNPNKPKAILQMRAKLKESLLKFRARDFDDQE